ncbi:MAG: 4Fe-4S dicluster domain-containing protein [Bacteroidales bacterium]|nr:4Fe-4S dicluster domain-containing protein [Bacteroidales bacterium]
MTKQIIFLLTLLATLGVFSYTISKLYKYFRLTKSAFEIKDIGKRLLLTLDVAILQSKIFRRRSIGLAHALVFWGFMVITLGSLEMIIDGISGLERSFSFAGIIYNFVIGSGDVFALIVLISILVFLFRRLFLNIKRFKGEEMKKVSKQDANIALLIILFLMISLLGMNMAYVAQHSNTYCGVYPVSSFFAQWFAGLNPNELHIIHELNWWIHILLIFVFANVLPYSKHFHVFMSIPNVFTSRLKPLGYIDNMDNITKEVQMMLDPEAAFEEPAEDEEPQRFGVKDVEDVTWKNYMDALSCTECGRCTSVCPANTTGKRLSPRKMMVDLRARMKEKGPELVKDAAFGDGKSYLRDYISEEEIWACTLCNACAQECPININQPSIILDLRRYLVMEEAAAPTELNTMFSNIENNGAPWQYGQHERLNWLDGFENELSVPLMGEKTAEEKSPEYLLWVGSAGAFDDRYKKVTRSFVKILNHLKIDFAVLGEEESSSGDAARRAGNEMLFQMQALTNIETFKAHGVKKILSCDPHAYNTFKNEYPDLGGDFEVIHHTVFLDQMIKEGKLELNTNRFEGKVFTYHDPCYLGRANGIYDAPRSILNQIPVEKREMPRSKSFSFCCGAGGAQMFKEAEKGDREVFQERTEEALNTGANIIVSACPYCMTMLTDGIKYKNKEESVRNLDIAELVAESLGI